MTVTLTRAPGVAGTFASQCNLTPSPGVGLSFNAQSGDEGSVYLGAVNRGKAKRVIIRVNGQEISTDVVDLGSAWPASFYVIVTEATTLDRPAARAVDKNSHTVFRLGIDRPVAP